MLTKARLWLARLLLPRGWVAAHEVNMDPAKMTFWSVAGKAPHLPESHAWPCTHHPTAPEPCARCDASAAAWWNGPRADTLGQDDIKERE